MQLVDYSSSLASIVPPLLALILAIITRKVILSLSLGILVGAIMLNDWNLLDAAIYIKDKIVSLVYAGSDEGLNANNVNIIIFLLLLGVLTALLSVSGSNQAFATWAQQHIKNRRGAKIMTFCLVFITFIDDYFHSLAVGAIARPVTDKFNISRAKLAYILDSTAAPMCVMMPVSSWGAYIITLIAGLLATHGLASQYSPLGAFLSMSLMNFYAIFSMVLVFVVAYFSFDIGSMARFEQSAMNRHEELHQTQDGVEGKVRNLIFPIIALISGTIASMMYTGNSALKAAGQAFSVLGAFENTTVGISLVVGSLCAIAVLTLCILIDGVTSRKDYFKSWGIGAKSMSGAILILFAAWTINGIVGDVQTGKYLSSLVAGNINPAFLPAILFILASVMAFSTGTSWGTFGIMLPIAATMAMNADPALFLPCLSAVMAGAICGDHCSPISDTTILSSTGAQCNHMDHVNSQLPYAMIVALSSTIGYLVLGFSESGLAGFATTGLILLGLILLFKKNVK